MNINAKEKIKSFFDKIQKKIMSGIAWRWVVNIFGPVFAVVILACLILCVFVNNFYTMSAINTIKTEAQSTSKYFEDYVYPQYRDFATCAQLLVSDFDNKRTMEIQVSNTSGKIAYSSTGFAISELNITPDVIDARDGKSSTWTGKFESTGEKIMSVSFPLYNTENRVCGTVRMVSSLENLNSMLTLIFIIVWLIGLSIIALTAFSGLYFIKSIVIPVNQINDITLEIAEGNLTTSELNNKSSDEIGQLCRNITTMANKLSDSQKVKNDFISQISHELRTPITAIRGWSETMMADPNLDELTMRGVTIINSETGRLSKMVEEMLDMSRMQNGRLNISLAPISIVAEFEDTVFMMSERSKGENVNIIYNVSDEEYVIDGDKDRLKQVFFNVIDNAIKHSNPGSDVIASVEKRENMLCFIVEDFGTGIKKEDLPFIKEMFYKGASQKRGSGIGLGVSDEIMRLHGGFLNIESEYGIGTTVTIMLPIKEALQNDNTDRP